MYARAQAFASRAAFGTPARRVGIGDPVAGFLEPTSGGATSAQMVGWDVTSMLNWPLTSAVWGIPRFAKKPAPPLQRASPIRRGTSPLLRCMYMVPQMVASDLSYARFPHSAYTYVAAPLFSDAIPSTCLQAGGIAGNLKQCGSRAVGFIPPRRFLLRWAVDAGPVSCALRWYFRCSEGSPGRASHTL